MLKPHPITRRDLLSLVVVLLAASMMRLGDIGIVAFRHDEAVLSSLAQDAASLKSVPLLGLPSSVGLPAPAASVYLMAVPYALSDNPLIATAYVALLNVAGVGLVWWIARRYFGATAALAAGLAYAVNPWALMFSRKIWTPDLHTPFILLAFAAALYGLAENAPQNRRRQWAQVLWLPLFVFAAQVYMWSLAVFPAFLWLVWIGRKTLAWRALSAGIVLTIISLIPFAVGIAQTTGAFSLTAFLSSRQERSIDLSDKALATATQFATGTGVDIQAAGKEQVDILRDHLPIPSILWTIVIGGATAAGVVGIRRRWRPLAASLFLWILLPVLSLTPTWTDVYDHYLVPLLPAFCLLVGAGITWLVSGNLITLRSAGIFAAFGAVVLTQALWWRGLMHYTDTQPLTRGFLGIPLHYMLDVRDELTNYKDVVIVTDDYWMMYDQEPGAWYVMLRRSADCVRAIGGNNFAVFPQDPFAVLITPRAPQNPAIGLYSTDSPKIYPLRPGDGQYAIHHFDQAPAWSGPPLASVNPVRFDNGAVLTGYHLEPDLMFLEWAVTRSQSENYQYFGHFLDANGERIGQRDGTFLPGRSWCEGDRVITWIDANIPEGITILRIGMYFLGQGSSTGQVYPSNILDEASNFAGQWVDIPLEPQAS